MSTFNIRVNFGNPSPATSESTTHTEQRFIPALFNALRAATEAVSHRINARI